MKEYQSQITTTILQKNLDPLLKPNQPILIGYLIAHALLELVVPVMLSPKNVPYAYQVEFFRLAQ